MAEVVRIDALTNDDGRLRALDGLTFDLGAQGSSSTVHRSPGGADRD